jgi:hypothetical protein
VTSTGFSTIGVSAEDCCDTGSELAVLILELSVAEENAKIK